MFWKRNHHVSVFLCELNVGSNEYNALLYIPSVIQLFCMVFFVARHIYNLNNVYVCTYVPSQIAFSSTEQESNILIHRPDICQLLWTKISSVEKTEDERDIQVPNVCPKTNTKRGKVHQSVFRSRVVYKYCYNFHFYYQIFVKPILIKFCDHNESFC